MTLHPPPVTPPLLEFDNITVFRGEKKVLDSLSVTIGEGENIAILGPNGAGKSSFIRTIMREFYPAQSDHGFTFRMRGREVWDVFEMRSHLGVYPMTCSMPLCGNSREGK